MDLLLGVKREKKKKKKICIFQTNLLKPLSVHGYKHQMQIYCKTYFMYLSMTDLHMYLKEQDIKYVSTFSEALSLYQDWRQIKKPRVNRQSVKLVSLGSVFNGVTLIIF